MNTLISLSLPRCEYGLVGFDGRCKRQATHVTVLYPSHEIGFWCSEHKGPRDRPLTPRDAGKGHRDLGNSPQDYSARLEQRDATMVALTAFVLDRVR